MTPQQMQAIAKKLRDAATDIEIAAQDIEQVLRYLPQVQKKQMQEAVDLAYAAAAVVDQSLSKRR